MRVLDVSAGRRAIWFDKEDAVATFVDHREEVRPGIVCDSRTLDGVEGPFDLIVFDPPHTNTGKCSAMTKRYGHTTAAQLDVLLAETAKATHRVSKPDALMAFKWSDRDRKLTSVLPWLSPYWRPLFGHGVSSRPRRSTGTRQSVTYWVMLVRTMARRPMDAG